MKERRKVLLKYSGIIYNDITAAPGLCLSFFVQGCPHHCVGCHNPETWDFEGGIEFTPETLENILMGLTAQDIERSFCLMGGEPLCDQNVLLSYLVVSAVKERLPNVKVYIWSGYTYEQLLQSNNKKVAMVLDLADYLIDGPYIAAERDLTLDMRGSRNQRIIALKDETKENGHG